MISRIIKHRLMYEDKNFILIITGPPGSGKTYACLSIGELVDPDFTINHVTIPTDDNRGLIPLLNSGTLKKGNVVVMEEAGISLSAREWQSFSNRAINTVLQTFRHENICLIMNVPFLSLIDTNARKLCHGYGEMLYIDRKINAGVMKYFNVHYSSRYDKILFKYPRELINGNWAMIKKIAIPRPSDKLLAEYKPLEKEFKIALREGLGEEIKKIKEMKLEKENNKRQKVDVEECVGKVIKKPDLFLNEYQGRMYLVAQVIREHFNCTHDEAKLIKRKGEIALSLN